MSEDRVEIVREAFLAMSDGWEATLPHVAENFVMVTPGSLAAEPDTYRGHAGIRRWFDSFYEAVDEIRITPGRVEPAGEHVLAEFNMTTRGRTTGLEASQAAVGVCSVTAGKVTRLEFFTSWEEALAAIDD
jgi:ketosteroid isomerase-like protein